MLVLLLNLSVQLSKIFYFIFLIFNIRLWILYPVILCCIFLEGSFWWEFFFKGIVYWYHSLILSKIFLLLHILKNLVDQLCLLEFLQLAINSLVRVLCFSVNCIRKTCHLLRVLIRRWRILTWWVSVERRRFCRLHLLRLINLKQFQLRKGNLEIVLIFLLISLMLLDCTFIGLVDLIVLLYIYDWNYFFSEGFTPLKRRLRFIINHFIKVCFLVWNILDNIFLNIICCNFKWVLLTPFLRWLLGQNNIHMVFKKIQIQFKFMGTRVCF